MEITKDYFDEKFEHIDRQFRSVHLDIKDIKETLDRVDKRDLEDSNAFAKSLLAMNKDIQTLKTR